MKVDGGLLVLGAIFALGWWLRGRSTRRRMMAYAPPPVWGGQYPQSKVSAKKAMVVIVLVTGVLFGMTFAGGAAGKSTPKHKSTGKNAGMLESLFGQGGKLKLPEIAKPGKVAKVPHGLSFTNGAGCSPKGDWAKVDARVRTVLANVAKHHSIRVSCMHTGHSTYVKGTRRVSNHTVWRAFDIDRVDGRAVRSWNLNALAVARALGRGKYGAQPSEVGSPWALGGIWFTDSGHKNHLHVGFGRR